MRLGDEGAKQGMIQGGVPAFVAKELVTVVGMLRQGVAEQVTHTIELLTGTSPRAFASFARDHARLFAPAAIAG